MRFSFSFVRACSAVVTLALPAVAADAQSAPPPAPTPVAAVSAPAPARTPRRSWTSDRRDFVVGDIITVTVDEFTLAASNSGNVASDRRRRQADIDIRKPGVGALSTNAGFGTRNDGESQQRGEATRQNRFQSDMSVRVVAVDPATGLLQIKGSKMTNIDKNEQLVTLTGWVRPQDVSPQNVVESLRVADAALTYQAKGNLDKPRGGFLSRLVGKLWP